MTGQVVRLVRKTVDRQSLLQPVRCSKAAEAEEAAEVVGATNLKCVAAERMAGWDTDSPALGAEGSLMEKAAELKASK